MSVSANRTSLATPRSSAVICVHRARLDLMLDGGAELRLRDGRPIRVRPIRPGDAEAVQAFVRGLSEISRRLRFFASIRELTPGMLERLTDIDAGSDRVLIVRSEDAGVDRIVALAQYAADDDGESCDLALVIADDWQGLGLGALLMDTLLETARNAGFARAEADVLRDNDGMLGLARAFGFAVTRSPIDATMVRIVRRFDEVPRSDSVPHFSLAAPRVALAAA